MVVDGRGSKCGNIYKKVADGSASKGDVFTKMVADGRGSKCNIFTKMVTDGRVSKCDIFTEKSQMEVLPSVTYLQKRAKGPRWDWVSPDSPGNSTSHVASWISKGKIGCAPVIIKNNRSFSLW